MTIANAFIPVWRKIGVEQKLDAFRQKRKASGCLVMLVFHSLGFALFWCGFGNLEMLETHWMGRRNDRRDRRRQKTRGLLLLAVRRGSEEDEMLSMGEGIGGLDACCGQRQSISAQRQTSATKKGSEAALCFFRPQYLPPSLLSLSARSLLPSLSTVFTYSPFFPVFSSK
mgnify:CR=1 FL=1